MIHPPLQISAPHFGFLKRANLPRNFVAIAWLACLPLSASAFVTTFAAWEALPYGTEIAGREGWTISDPGTDPSPSYSLSYSSYIYASSAGSVGELAIRGAFESGVL